MISYLFIGDHTHSLLLHNSCPEDVRGARQTSYFFNLILNRRKYNPLFIKNDTMIVFDHVNLEAVVMNDAGMIIKTSPILLHLREDWNYQMI